MYTHIALGGTFDGLHTGHQHFLTQVFQKGRRVTIGLTSARYIRRYKKGSGVSPYSKRYQALTAWLRKEGLAPQAVVVPLHDAYGPAVLGNDFDAIAVTQDNKSVAQEINRIRDERGFPALSVIEIDLIAAQDTRPISSTRIRAGEIDQTGKLMLPDNLRPELQKPMGQVLLEREIAYSVIHNRDNVMVAVGDVTVKKIFSYGIQPSLAIIDLFVERKPYQTLEAYKFPKKYTVQYVKSGPGFVAKRAIHMIKQWSRNVKKRTVIVVEGEEDLLAIPAMIHAPLGSMLYYGQPARHRYAQAFAGGPGEGLVEVHVTAAKKKTAVELLRRFT